MANENPTTEHPCPNLRTAEGRFDYANAMLNEIIAHLAWQVDQPNSHPVELYEPLLLAIQRRLQKREAARAGRPAQGQPIERMISDKD